MSSNPFKSMENAIDFHHSTAAMKIASYFVIALKRISPEQDQ